MNKIPATPQEWQEQIRHYEWLKMTFPHLYPQVVQFAEQRPERTR